MRVGVLSQVAQSICLVRLQLLARPVISRAKLLHVQEHTQNGLNIHIALSFYQHFSVDFALLLRNDIQELLWLL